MAAAKKAELLAKCRDGRTDEAFLECLQEVAMGPLSRTPEDVEILLAYTQGAWIADQRKPSAIRARDGARRLIELAPDFADGYRLLGFASLTRGDYLESFLALSAIKTLTTPANFDNFRAMACLLMSGTSNVAFDLAEERYSFDLTAHNAAAMESSAFHSVNMLTEWEELQYLAATLDYSQIRRIVEVGVLLGNHSAFFLKEFQPEHLTLIDADIANIPFIERTVSLNMPARNCPVKLDCAFVSQGTGKVTFAGTAVEKRSLSELVSNSVDFLKIDVDGSEEQLLKGAARIIESYKPAVMIETTPLTHEAVISWFDAKGYSISRVFDHGSYRNAVLLP